MSEAPLLPCPPVDAGVLVGRTVDLERLNVLRHGADLWRAIGGNDESWAWIPSGPFPTEVAFFDWLNDRGQRPSQSLYAVMDKTRAGSPRAEGLYMALSVNPDAGTAELGLNLGAALGRRAGGTEAFHLLAGDIFAKGYRRLEWRCSPENDASSRAARRFGFTLEGVLRQTHWLKGFNWDTEVWSILDREWPTIDRRLQGWLAAENFDARGEQLKPLSAF